MANNVRVKMPHQDPAVRVQNFEEVALGYTEEMAREEAARCLNCRHKPCVSACPVGIDIPRFIMHLKNGENIEAYNVIREDSSLPAVCGRVCPQEKQCESKCVRGIKGQSVAIGNLERFAADYAMQHGATKSDIKMNENGKRVAVIGSGPSGIACAGELVKLGLQPEIFEALHQPGGVLVYGIPEFRLPISIVNEEINALRDMGVKIHLNEVIGRTYTIDELFEEGFCAVYIANGAGLPRFMNIEGEGLKGVFSANEYLTRMNLMKAYSKESDTPIIKSINLAVVGGGNVAMDAARCARRMGANVKMVYRRSREDMPARLEEIEHAVEEGVELLCYKNPLRILADESGWVKGLELISMQPGEPDASGRQTPVEVPGSEEILEVDAVVMALGTRANPLITGTTPDLETNAWGNIVTLDESGRTSKKGVFAGGDAVTGAATVILAMGAGKAAAKAIAEYVETL